MFSVKGQIVKYFILSKSFAVSVKILALLLCGQSSHRQYISEWVWLCTNKTIDKNKWMARFPVGYSLPTLGIKYVLMKDCCILAIESNLSLITQCELKVTRDLDG